MRNHSILPPLMVGLLAVAVFDVSPAQAEAATTGGESQLMTNLPSNFNGGNVNALVGANRFYGAGITGQNTVTANVEAGHIWNGHESLGHVTQFINHSTALNSDSNPATPEYDRHATWVGSMIGGRNGGAITGQWQPGIASGTDLRSGAIATGWSGSAYSGSFGISRQSMATPYATFFGSADVINSSWGGTDSAGSSFLATDTDGLANQNTRTTFVVSAGNAGPAANTVGSPATGYNNIVVGALQNDGNNRYTSVASFSSRGPSDYSDPVNGTVTGVRAEVDLVAPGTNLTAAFYGGQAGGNNPALAGSINNSGSNFYSLNVAGTSFAAPIVAGGAALLSSASKNTPDLAANADSRDARVVKAVLMNSADKIAGWNNGQTANPNGSGGVVTTQALDYASGAGALNLDKAYDQYIDAGTRDVAGLVGGTVEEVGWDFGQVDIAHSNSYLINDYLQGGSMLTVTLGWFRERSFDVGTLTANDLAQANLDLIVRDIISGMIVSKSMSIYNTVEHLSFLLPTTSRYQLEISYVGNLFGSITSEQYGLAWSGTAVPTPATPALIAAGAGAYWIRRRRLATSYRVLTTATSGEC